jgi:hypothetical protein
MILTETIGEFLPLQRVGVRLLCRCPANAT